uniref:hypothetical protein n=1 Tax=Paenirhodobacter enshiensis TaxID=1105367 RepID=UPI0035AEDAA9
MENLNKRVSGWIAGANGNGVKGTEIALAAIRHIPASGDSTLFARMFKVDNKSYQKNLGLIAAAFGMVVVKDKDGRPTGMRMKEKGVAMAIDPIALRKLEQAAEDKLPLGGSRLATLFGKPKVEKPAPVAEPEPEAENETESAEILMLPAPDAVTPYTLVEQIIAYVGDMSLQDLDAIMDAIVLRKVELAQKAA